MATPYRGFQLGLLPERKIDKRALMTSYGLVTLVVLVFINLSLILPEQLQLVRQDQPDVDDDEQNERDDAVGGGDRALVDLALGQ